MNSFTLSVQGRIVFLPCVCMHIVIPSHRMMRACTCKVLSCLSMASVRPQGRWRLGSSFCVQRVQGDLEDRKKIQSADVAREKELKAQRDQDERLLEARKLAGMGLSVIEIEAELKRIKMVCALPPAVPAESACTDGRHACMH